MLRLLRQFLAAILSLALGFPAYACAVGNRKQITSTLAAIPAGLFNYDANDRFTAGDTYDNNGNTITSGGTANVVVYPERSRGNFENHLIQQGGISIIYDGRGSGYLVDDRNPTGYAQVYTETTGSTTRLYVLGLELVAERFSGGSTITRYYDYDGHGSVRADGHNRRGHRHLRLRRLRQLNSLDRHIAEQLSLLRRAVRPRPPPLLQPRQIPQRLHWEILDYGYVRGDCERRSHALPR